MTPISYVRDRTVADIFSGQRIPHHLHGGLRVAVTDLNVIWIVATIEVLIEALTEALTEGPTELEIVTTLVATPLVVVLLLVSVLHAEMPLLLAETSEMEGVAEAIAGLLHVVLPAGAVTGTEVVVQRPVTGEEIAIAMIEMTETKETI